jgi:prepilin-type N-terminal cleavage/methylation domain-containing protein
MNWRNLKAFTLIEIVMVLVITGLILAVAAPQWTKYLTYWDMETEARKIMAKIREAQEKAILDHRASRIVFDTGTNSYRLENYNGGWSEEETISFQTKDSYLAVTTLPYQTETTLPPDQTNPPGYVLTFDEFGATTQGTFPSPQATITLRTKDNTRSLDIQISKITGRVSVTY